MSKLIWTINKVENSLGVKIRRNATVLGLDTATKSGYCIAKTDSKKLILNVGFINIDVGKIEDRVVRNELRYNAFYDAITNLIASSFDTVVIEDVFFSRNVLSLILLARIGAIAFTVCKVKGIKQIVWKSAVQARKLLGLPCNKKKDVVQKFFCKKMKIDLTNEDEIDSIILALVGLLQ
jgi:Holliday junction resolvasome RuvABC endonuclease subunit